MKKLLTKLDLFMIKPLQKVGIDGTDLNIIKVI